MDRVVIIGAGPAGLFAAREVALRTERDVEVVVYEQGPSLEDRLESGEVMRGVGGAGGLSDGVLNLRPDVGGDLISIVGGQEVSEQTRRVRRRSLPEARSTEGTQGTRRPEGGGDRTPCSGSRCRVRPDSTTSHRLGQLAEGRRIIGP
nr:NAD(P)/FAD-dependent oxidoreductase [Methanopyrus sp. SNP6]